MHRPDPPLYALATAFLLTGSLPAAHAAPLDALLDAAPLQGASSASTSPRLQLEVSADRVNDQLDLFKLRSGDPRYAGTRIGDYSGGHLLARVEHERLRLEGQLWRRALQDRADVYHFNSWQFAGQLRLSDDDAQAASGQSWALRASLWGNRANTIVRSTNSRLAVVGLDTVVTSVQLNGQHDRQRQLDLIFSQRLNTRHTVSAHAGAGSSQVSNTSVSGSSRIGACPYELAFGSSTLTASPSGSCTNSAPSVRVPNSLLPYAAEPETNYSARYLQAGVSHRWQGQTWGTRLGLGLERWQRDRIDQLISQRKAHAYTRNITLVGELGARLAPGFGAVLRGQLMQHQFLTELPLAYNTLSASRFGAAYGIATFGLTAEF
jgi:hypothetical protein